MRKIFVSRVGGFVGAALVRRLLKEDAHIWTIDKYFRDGVLPDSNKVTKINTDDNELKCLFENTEYDLFNNFA